MDVLVGASGSWAELKHDTILYTKQGMVMAEGGHQQELPVQKAAGYVEPVPELYRAISVALTALEPRLDANAKSGLLSLQELLKFLADVSELELSGAPFPPEADERLRGLGPELEHMTRGHADEPPSQALIADVGAYALPTGEVLPREVATGKVDVLWVVVPRGGKLLLTRGGVFSYYEFNSNSRLDDGEWERQLYEGVAPPRPGWAQPVADPALEKARKARAKARAKGDTLD